MIFLSAILVSVFGFVWWIEPDSQAESYNLQLLFGFLTMVAFITLALSSFIERKERAKNSLIYISASLFQMLLGLIWGFACFYPFRGNQTVAIPIFLIITYEFIFFSMVYEMFILDHKSEKQS